MRKFLSVVAALALVAGMSLNVLAQDNQPSPSDATTTNGVQTVVTPSANQAPVEPVAGAAVGSGCVGCGGQVMSTSYGGMVYSSGCSSCGTASYNMGCGSCVTNTCNTCNTCDRNRIFDRRDNCCNVSNDCGRRVVLARNNCNSCNTCNTVNTCNTCNTCNAAPVVNHCNTCNTCNATPVVSNCNTCNTVPVMAGCNTCSTPVSMACNTPCSMPMNTCGSVQPTRVARVQMVQPRGTFVRLGGRR